MTNVCFELCLQQTKKRDSNNMNDSSEFNTNNYATSEEDKALNRSHYNFNGGFYTSDLASEEAYILRVAPLAYPGPRYIVSRDEDYAFADRDLWEFQDFDSALEFLRDNLCPVCDGDGYREKNVHADFNTDYGYIQEVICDECEGRGTL